VKLLVDNMFPIRLGKGLGELFADQHHVEHIREKFGTGSLSDEEWIKRLGSEGGWSVLSGDRRIASNRLSRNLFLSNNLVGFFPKSAVLDMPFHKQVSRILTVWPLMEAIAASADRGCYAIGASGSKLQGL
jgi:PIN like domain